MEVTYIACVILVGVAVASIVSRGVVRSGAGSRRIGYGFGVPCGALVSATIFWPLVTIIVTALTTLLVVECATYLSVSRCLYRRNMRNAGSE